MKEAGQVNFCFHSGCFTWQKYVEEMRTILMDKDWKVQTTICWGERDRWLSYDGVEDFCKRSNHKLLKLPMVPTVLTHLHLLGNINFRYCMLLEKKSFIDIRQLDVFNSFTCLNTEFLLFIAYSSF